MKRFKNIFRNFAPHPHHFIVNDTVLTQLPAADDDQGVA